MAPPPPRTGMPSATIAKAVARSVVDRIEGAPGPTRTASMAEMGAACVASAGVNPFTGTAASMTEFPIVPDFERYPEYGRDQRFTFGEIGMAGTGSRSSCSGASRRSNLRMLRTILKSHRAMGRDQGAPKRRP